MQAEDLVRRLLRFPSRWVMVSWPRSGSRGIKSDHLMGLGVRAHMMNKHLG